MHVTLADQQIHRVAFVFTLLIFAFEAYVIGVDHSNYFVYLLDSQTLLFGVIAVISILIAAYLFFRFVTFLMSAAWPYKVVGFLIVAASLVVEYGYQKALGRFSDRIDVETALAATPDQQTAAVLMYFNRWAIVPCVVLLIILFVVRSEKARDARGFLLGFFPIVIGFGLFPFVVDQKFPTLATNAFIRTGVDFTVNGPITTGTWASTWTGIEVRRREVARPPLPEGHRPANNVVLVVDESMMGDHFSLNGYSRETTPFLDKLAARGLIQNWGIAAAASTGSRFTYTALVTGLTPDDFPDKTEFKVNTFPTLFQYAKAMGYTTHFFDGQMNAYWGGVPDDRNYFDTWQGVLDVSDHRAFETYDLDNLIAAKVKTIISSSSGNFVFVFKHGAHIPYNIDFPADRTVWAPSYETADKYDIPPGSMLPAVVNAYDNAIRYNVDSFFMNIADDHANLPNNSVIIYTGDHGQTLFANGRSSHGGNSRQEATVPLFVLGKLPGPVDTSYKASHANVFPTVLDLFGYPPDLRDKRGFPSLLTATKADSRPRYFNPDLGVKVLFDQ